MEVAGLAVGVAGLAGLFACCNSAFQLVQRGRSFGKDYKILETKFGNQELRLRAWGRACGLVDGTEYDTRLDDPELYRQLQATLECIKWLLGDAKELKERYGLRSCQTPIIEEQSETVTSGSPLPETSDITRLERRRSLNQLLFRRSKSLRSRPTSTYATARWVIEDREKFSELVQHLKDFIDDLEALTKATEVPRRQLIFVEYEIESISDVEVLEEIENAREGDEDVVSDAASARLERLSQGTASIRASMESGTNGSFMTLESYVTARSQFSLLRTSIAASDDSGNIAAIQVAAGNNLGDKDAQQQETWANFDIVRRTKPVYKCVVVGDLSARKTELLSIFTLGNIDQEYTPVVLNETRCHVQIDRCRTILSLWDTSGLENYENLRRGFYTLADVVIVCYTLGIQHCKMVRKKWALEVQALNLQSRCILAGIEPGPEYKSSPSDFSEGKNLAKEIGAVDYIQCNIETGVRVDALFEVATRVAIRANEPPRFSRGWKLPWRNETPRLSVIDETKDEITTGFKLLP